MPDAPPLLKDMIDRAAVGSLARAVAAESDLDTEAFLAEVFNPEFEALALKARIRSIATILRHHLPTSYPAALDILRRAATSVTDAGMAAWALCDFVELFGLDDPDRSIPALEQFTMLISAEFAVRAFIEAYPERMYAQHLAWASHADPRVRRLASEGLRPRLPWGRALKPLQTDPEPILPILEMLKGDASEDVRRSVANNLNDIAKDHPDLVVDVLTAWEDGTPEMAALTKHALRTLLKQGHPRAMALLGYSSQPQIELTDFSVDPPTLPVGATAILRFSVTSLSPAVQPLMVDFAVVFQNASGSGSRKVFKGTTSHLEPGERLTQRRKISLIPMSTRKIFPGTHRVEVLVNGVVAGNTSFEVTGGNG